MAPIGSAGGHKGRYKGRYRETTLTSDQLCVRHVHMADKPVPLTCDLASVPTMDEQQLGWPISTANHSAHQGQGEQSSALGQSQATAKTG